MFFPEFLFQPSQRDYQVSWLDPLLTFVGNAAAAAAVTADFTVPDGRALMLQSAVLVGTPGAAQNVAEKRISVLPSTGLDVRIAGNSTPDGVNINGWLNWTGSILLPADTIVRGSVAFNAGAASNSVRIELVGILIPIGNIQRI